MDSAGFLRVIEFSTGRKSVYADVALAPSNLRTQVAAEVATEVDLDAHEPGEVIGRVEFTDLLGDPDYDYELDEAVVPA